MPTYAVTFRLQSNSEYNELSREQPNVEFNLWCNFSRHVMEASFSKVSRDTILESIRKTARAVRGTILRQVAASSTKQLVVLTCSCSRYRPTSWSTIAKHNCLDLQPTTYQAGWERYRVLAFQQSDLKALLASLSKLGNLEVLSQTSRTDFSLRENFVLSTADLFGDMTAKQSEALAEALRLGYFKIPRRISTDDIARSLKRPPTTFREHLHKGESKLLKNVEPYLELTMAR